MVEHCARTQRTVEVGDVRAPKGELRDVLPIYEIFLRCVCDRQGDGNDLAVVVHFPIRCLVVRIPIGKACGARGFRLEDGDVDVGAIVFPIA